MEIRFNRQNTLGTGAEGLYESWAERMGINILASFTSDGLSSCGTYYKVGGYLLKVKFFDLVPPLPFKEEDWL